MSRTFDQSCGFDEYGHYGENNPPVGSTEEIRPMTDEERQRAKEREEKNRE